MLFWYAAVCIVSGSCFISVLCAFSLIVVLQDGLLAQPFFIDMSYFDEHAVGESSSSFDVPASGESSSRSPKVDKTPSRLRKSGECFVYTFQFVNVCVCCGLL